MRLEGGSEVERVLEGFGGLEEGSLVEIEVEEETRG